MDDSISSLIYFTVPVSKVVLLLQFLFLLSGLLSLECYFVNVFRNILNWEGYDL